MLKLRVQGMPNEAMEMLDYLDGLPRIRVLEVSGPYKNRAPSEYVRYYLDVTMEGDTKPMRVPDPMPSAADVPPRTPARAAWEQFIAGESHD